MSILETCEWSDEYRTVVATIGPRFRVIEDRRGFGWNLQQRRARRAGHGRWFSVASFIMHRESLASRAIPLMHSGYVKDQGITQEVVDAALAHLPERFSPEPTYDHLTVHTRPQVAAPVSYKTAHDIFPRP
ncbi:MAG: hypothetical protein EOS52_25040 [Mesorhizobium sp.]|uniref:hypothetical protein n=1 Tax=Mesorhizobium sp. TaxID=1871066 RepID=UPI000FE4FD4A|nr:hypothetical protein [Mesorhizobium sp.]RWC10380.1 MAG: hypothetical protein EOS52_25040 [Mesorhizobium sp.]